jgi:alpha-N-arabinofuranosidase
MANLAQTVNVLQALVLTEKEKMLLTPTYHVFDLYTVHHDAKLLKINFTSPDYTNGEQKIPALNASASRDSTGAIHITIVNLDPNKNTSVATNFNGMQWNTVTGRIVTSENLTDINTFQQSNKIRATTFNGGRKEGNNLVVELPAKSVVMLELK